MTNFHDAFEGMTKQEIDDFFNRINFRLGVNWKPANGLAYIGSCSL